MIKDLWKIVILFILKLICSIFCSYLTIISSEKYQINSILIFIIIYFLLNPLLNKIYEGNNTKFFLRYTQKKRIEQINKFKDIKNQSYLETKFLNDLDLLRNSIYKSGTATEELLNIISKIFDIIVYLIFMAYASKEIFIIFLISFIILLITNIWHSHKDYENKIINVNNELKAKRYCDTLINPKEVRDLKQFGKEYLLVDKSIGYYKIGCLERFNLRRQHAFILALIRFGSFIIIFVALMLGAKFKVKYFFTLIYTTLSIISLMHSLTYSFSECMNLFKYRNYINNFYKQYCEDNRNVEVDKFESIEFKDVSFLINILRFI